MKNENDKIKGITELIERVYKGRADFNTKIISLYVTFKKTKLQEVKNCCKLYFDKLFDEKRS